MKTHGRHWRRRLVGLLFPSGKVALPLAAFCAAALAWIFGCGLDGTSAAYAVYAVSFYALVAFTGWTVRAGRRGWQRVSALPLVTWWQADACQRVRAGLALSLLVNLCYAGCKIVSAVLYTSVWEAALGIYYLLLCGVRAFLLRQMPAAGGEAAFQFLMTACTAAAVCGLVLGLALFMICSAGRRMQRFDREDRI